MDEQRNKQEVEQLFAEFAAGSLESTPSEPQPVEITEPETSKETPQDLLPVPKKRIHKKILFTILAILLCLSVLAAHLLRPLPIQKVTLSAGAYDIMAISQDGRILSTGAGSDSTAAATGPTIQDTSGWTDIVSISVGDLHTLGIKKDGTVVSTDIVYADGTASGDGTSLDEGQTQVGDWKNIVAVSAGLSHSVGLRRDGTVLAVGNNLHGQCDVAQWRNIVAIETGATYTAGLRKDGTVVITAPQDDPLKCAETWTDIVAISSSNEHILGLRDDGTVVAAGYDPCGRCDVATWTDIVSISAGLEHSVGLKKDGTVISTERFIIVASPSQVNYGQGLVSDWTDIVAIETTQFHTVGLTSDGKILLAGLTTAPYTAVTKWSDIWLP